MKEQARTSFRTAPHTSGETAVKLKDFVESGSIEALNSYEAWELMKSAGAPLEIGDVLESELGGLKICKYIGFDDAKWILPEVKPAAGEIPVAAGVPTENAAEGKL